MATTIKLEREKEARRYVDETRAKSTGIDAEIEKAYIAGCENEARMLRWRNPLVSMPNDSERVLVAVLSANEKISVRVMRASRKETTDFSSPIVFKAIAEYEQVAGWLPLPEFNPSNVKDYE